MAHALLSPSSSHRWLVCTPAPRLEATLPEPKRPAGSKDFSGEGTLGHSLSEAKLRFQLDMIGSKEYDTEINLIKQNPLYSEELEEISNTYVNFVRSQIGSGDVVDIEARVDISEYAVECFGSADCIIVSENKITVVDLKCGSGAVSATDNTQLKLYALGAYERYKDRFPKIKEARYIIVQPRLDSISEDHTTIEKLTDWGKHFVKPRSQKAWIGAGDFIAGDHCNWCKAKGQCRARADFNNAVAQQEFRDPPLLNDDEISDILGKASQIKSWLGDIEDYALAKAVTQGECPTGYKLGTTSTHRKITDAHFAATVLKEKGIDESLLWEAPKLKSVSALEKLAPKGQVVAWLGDLVQRPVGSPKLVKIKDTTREDFS